MREDMQQRAASWCDFINADRTCALMQALHTESDPRCKYWREGNSERCRYFELHIINTGRRSRASRVLRSGTG